MKSILLHIDHDPAMEARLQVEGLRLERVTISKIETGYREVTDVEAMAIAKALGVSVGWLMGEA